MTLRSFTQNVVPRQPADSPVQPFKTQQQVIGTMFGFLPNDLRQRCGKRPITSGLPMIREGSAIDSHKPTSRYLFIENPTSAVRAWENSLAIRLRVFVLNLNYAI